MSKEDKTVESTRKTLKNLQAENISAIDFDTTKYKKNSNQNRTINSNTIL